MKDSATVTIIVSVYRTPPDLLSRCLQSLETQSMRGIEIIAVDDASADDTPALLERLAGDMKQRIQVVQRQVNGGAAAARNDGLERARGRYVLFADADDHMRPDMCARLVEVAEREQADIVACSWAVTDADGNVREQVVLPDTVYDLTNAIQKRRCYRDLTFAPWNKLFRRSVIQDLRFERFAVNIGEDTLFNVMAVCQAQRVATTSYVGYDYTVHEASATGKVSKDLAYLEALADSDRRIRESLRHMDGSPEALQAADWLSLKRFGTGCAWIAEGADPAVRRDLWRQWQAHWRETLAPALSHRTPVAALCGLGVRTAGPSAAACFIRWAMRAADPGRSARREHMGAGSPQG